MIQTSTMKRLGTSAGRACASGAVQRLEQSVANIEQKNDTTEEGIDLFRKAMCKAFLDTINRDVTSPSNA